MGMGAVANLTIDTPHPPRKYKNERGKENNQGQGTQTKQTEAQEAPSL